jgi:N,N'-diacetyllegionaminate synthase
MIPEISADRRLIGPEQPVFIIAEGGVNHNGSRDLALQLIDAAADAGADAIKFQTWKTELVVSREAPKAQYQVMTTANDASQFDMVRKLELAPHVFREISSYAAARGIMFFSTPFDLASVDLLMELEVPIFKIPSGEINHFPLLAKVARTGKPAILSTGMSTLGEVESAVNCLRAAGIRGLAILHCVSSYPTPMGDANLRAMHTLEEAFRVPVGFSDHTLGSVASIAAVALGATIIEKHLTLDRSMPGPDHQASLDPAAFKTLVGEIRLTEQALGDGVKRPQPSEMNVRAVARRSIVAARSLPAGTKLVDGDLLMKRPGTGLQSVHLPSVIGRALRNDLAEDALLTWSDLEPA